MGRGSHMRETVWKEMPEIDIVYRSSPYSCVQVGDKTYPKAFVVEHDDKEMMDTALRWGRMYGSSPKVVTTKNEGFAMRLAQAATASSQSGKLAFWMCAFERDDIEPFATGINAELLFLVLTQSTFVDGSLHGEKVIFARRDGQLGALHEHMPAYREYRESLDRRDAMKRGKTSKWVPGNMYETLTCHDVMMGEMVMPLWRSGDTAYKLDFGAKPKKIYGPRNHRGGVWALGRWFECGDAPDELDDFEACLAQGIQRPHDKCPSRSCTGPAPFSSANHGERVVTALEKICLLACPGQQRAEHFAEEHEGRVMSVAIACLALCELDPQRGIACLDRLDETIRAMPRPTARMRWDKGARRWNKDAYDLAHDGTTEHFASEAAVALRVSELTQQHYGNAGNASGNAQP